MMTKVHKPIIKYVEGVLEIQQEDQFLQIPIEQLSDRLKHATDLERSIFKISPSGYGIHWPLIDEDIAIGKLMKDFSSYVKPFSKFDH